MKSTLVWSVSAGVLLSLASYNSVNAQDICAINNDCAESTYCCSMGICTDAATCFYSLKTHEDCCDFPIECESKCCYAGKCADASFCLEPCDYNSDCAI